MVVEICKPTEFATRSHHQQKDLVTEYYARKRSRVQDDRTGQRRVLPTLTIKSTHLKKWTGTINRSKDVVRLRLAETCRNPCRPS
eukprot:7912-Pyramimonas_sp.AAC.1